MTKSVFAMRCSHLSMSFLPNIVFLACGDYKFHLLRKGDLVALLYMCSCCCLAVSAVGLFLAMP